MAPSYDALIPGYLGSHYHAPKSPVLSSGSGSNFAKNMKRNGGGSGMKGSSKLTGQLSHYADTQYKMKLMKTAQNFNHSYQASNQAG